MTAFRFLALLVAFVSFLVQAQEPVPAENEAAVIDQIQDRLLSARPDLPIEAIEKSAIGDYYSIRVQGGMVLYVNESGDHFFAGDLYFVESAGFVNATEKARTGERKQLLDSLDESEMIVFAPAKDMIRQTITVFTDIDCGYCRKLHQEVPELNRLGIAVRYLAYPRAGVGSGSYDKAVSAWCADNQQLAMTRSKAGQEIEKKTCSNPVAAQFALGDQFGVNGTPAILYEDGTLQPGYLPASEMARRLGIN